jgi:hypothetical protein
MNAFDFVDCHTIACQPSEKGYPQGVNNPGASSGALTYENKKKRSKLRGIKPGRQRLMKVSFALNS